ncbi:alternate-type signal peptide domain-containing protein [Actinomyces mediterranea]|uniref:alternate-type signal peptide domain-containing protein n=1 Tax=Actinomyces mediterranea TaxID=1871028 RepID=UPI000970A14C|nr:alternate-type signal peptide domain-containing protein [Actinomyces mediterranea]
MSHSTRSLLALGAAIALLAGSGATFARWYDEAALDGGTITTGTLAIEKIGSPSWMINTPDSDHNGDATVPFDPSTEKIVPGDVVTYTSEVRLNLQGKNLTATLAVLPEGLDTSIPGITVSPRIDCGGANYANLTEKDNGKICTVSATLTYEMGADNETSALPELRGDSTKAPHEGGGWAKAPAEQAQAISISDFTVILEQQLRPENTPFAG